MVFFPLIFGYFKLLDHITEHLLENPYQVIQSTLIP